jgi:hypothetical protein
VSTGRSWGDRRLVLATAGSGGWRWRVPSRWGAMRAAQTRGRAGHSGATGGQCGAVEGSACLFDRRCAGVLARPRGRPARRGSEPYRYFRAANPDRAYPDESLAGTVTAPESLRRGNDRRRLLPRAGVISFTRSSMRTVLISTPTSWGRSSSSSQILRLLEPRAERRRRQTGRIGRRTTQSPASSLSSAGLGAADHTLVVTE